MATGKAPSELPQQKEAGKAPAPVEPETDVDGFIAQETKKDHRKGPFLVGRSDIGTVRRVTQQDFQSVGIDCRTLEFKWLEGYKLPLDSIPPAAVEFLLDNEYGFSISDE